MPECGAIQSRRRVHIVKAWVGGPIFGRGGAARRFRSTNCTHALTVDESIQTAIEGLHSLQAHSRTGFGQVAALSAGNALRAGEPLDEFLAGTGAWHTAALDIARGTSRYLRALGCAVVAELPLADGRRADLMALCPKGGITILEVKSCLADFRSDHKWEDYRQWCDRFYFAVDPAFPQDHIPDDCGLIVADRFDAEALREPPEHRLDAARRKAVTLRFARAAAFRLHGVDDPDVW
jgi:hypothetical protein